MKPTMEEVLEEIAYWEELAKELGWTMHAWSYKNTCQYWTDPPNCRLTVQLSGSQRDAIMNRIRKGEKA